MSLYLTALIIHITCAAIWIGGNVFFVSLIRLLSKRTEFAELRGKIIYAYVMAYRLATYLLFTLVLLSGLYLVHNRGLLNARLWQTTIGQMALAKLLLFTLLMSLQLFHDFIFGPRSFVSEGNRVVMRESHRRSNRMIGQIVFLLSLLMLVAGVLLSRGVSVFG
ncbi:MAG TPA: hypothetical protein PLF85_04460 [Turneriella sp.]|nr:hypothetical protein [Turneriella sp.]